mgnify:FL=1|tara:strand:+ start:529 stop:693 length:165 start_codon:yes stop_codon:yes gene_type:complete
MKKFKTEEEEADRLKAFDEFEDRLIAADNVKELLEFLNKDVNYKKAKNIKDVYE